MQKLASSKPSTTSAARPHLPDPATAGPYRPFTTDPHWNEARWWLGLPLLVFILLIVTYRLAPDIYAEWIIPEGYGVLEFSQL